MAQKSLLKLHQEGRESLLDGHKSCSTALISTTTVGPIVSYPCLYTLLKPSNSILCTEKTCTMKHGLLLERNPAVSRLAGHFTSIVGLRSRVKHEPRRGQSGPEITRDIGHQLRYAATRAPPFSSQTSRQKPLKTNNNMCVGWRPSQLYTFTRGGRSWSLLVLRGLRGDTSNLI